MNFDNMKEMLQQLREQEDEQETIAQKAQDLAIEESLRYVEELISRGYNAADVIAITGMVAARGKIAARRSGSGVFQDMENMKGLMHAAYEIFIDEVIEGTYEGTILPELKSGDNGKIS